jgi:hypothetical protein
VTCSKTVVTRDIHRRQICSAVDAEALVGKSLA